MTHVFKMHSLLFIIILILPGRDTGIYLYPNSTHPDHAGKCYLAGPPPKIISVGDTRRDSNWCAELFCDKDFTVYGTGCGTLTGPVHCHTIRGDPSKPYPQCCPEVIC